MAINNFEETNIHLFTQEVLEFCSDQCIQKEATHQRMQHSPLLSDPTALQNYSIVVDVVVVVDFAVVVVAVGVAVLQRMR